MKNLRLLLAGIVALFCWEAVAAQFKLSDGTTVEGEIISANESGMVLRTPDGKLSPRITWFKLPPETLAELAKDPKLKKYVEELVEPPPGESPANQIKKLDLIEPQKPERPTNVTFWGAALTPAGMAMGLVLLLANLFAAYEIAIFRNRQIPLVVISAAIVPLLAPLVFLALPTRRISLEPLVAPEPAAPVEAAPPALSPEEEAAEAIRAAEQSLASPPPLPEEAPSAVPVGIPDDEPAGPGLKIAKREGHATKADVNYRKTYKRGEQMISRRFFETTFPAFFRIAPGEFEKDLVLVFRTVRGEYIGQRISRIANDDLHLQKRAGDVSSETPIAFNDIIEVTIRHKDAK